MKETLTTGFLKVVRQGFRKPTERYIAKEAPFLVGVPLGLGGKSDQWVYR